MNRTYFIASCVYTARFPRRSAQILKYIRSRPDITPIRCCIPAYRQAEFESQMPADFRDEWRSLPHCADFEAGDTVYALCHNCLNIIEETKPQVRIRSLWELILEDPDFPYPDHGMTVEVQDCWRARDRTEEQNAVRALLERMNLTLCPADPSRTQTDFCGASLYRAQPSRNPTVAPRHYANQPGKFIPHTPEQQQALMREHCRKLHAPVVCYCHYCLEGLVLGGAQAFHLADLLFPDR